MALGCGSQAARVDRSLRGDELSVADLLCDRHAATPGKIALLCEDAAGNSTSYTFEELRERSARFAGNDFLTPAFAAIDKIAIRGLWGLSLVAVCRRTD